MVGSSAILMRVFRCAISTISIGMNKTPILADPRALQLEVLVPSPTQIEVVCPTPQKGTFHWMYNPLTIDTYILKPKYETADSMPFLSACRQSTLCHGRDNVGVQIVFMQAISAIYSYSDPSSQVAPG